MDLFIYDRNFNRLGTIDNHTELLWIRKYCECGEMELHCPATPANMELLKPGNIVAKGDRTEAAVIRGDQATEESNHHNGIIRRGCFLPVYFGDRLTGPMVNYSGGDEDAMRFMISRAVPIPMLRIAPPSGNQVAIEFQATYRKLLAILTKIGRLTDLGFRVVPDFRAKTMTFETYRGIDRSFTQRNNARVIFSEKYGNLDSIKHEYSDLAFATKITVGGAGEGSGRVFVMVGGGEGFDLREAFYDARNISGEGMGAAEYVAALEAAGRGQLEKRKIMESIETEIVPSVNFSYGRDYDLGDIVTVEKTAWGIRQDIRITEVCEVYEDGGMYIVPTLGHSLPVSDNFDEE